MFLKKIIHSSKSKVDRSDFQSFQLPAGPDNPLPDGNLYFMIQIDLTKLPSKTPPGGGDAVLLIAASNLENAPRLNIRYSRPTLDLQPQNDLYFGIRYPFDPIYNSLDRARPKEKLRLAIEVNRAEASAVFDLEVVCWAVEDLYSEILPNYQQDEEDFPLGAGRTPVPTIASTTVSTLTQQQQQQPTTTATESKKGENKAGDKDEKNRGEEPQQANGIVNDNEPSSSSARGISPILVVLIVLAALAVILMVLIVLVRVKRHLEDKAAADARPPSVYMANTSNTNLLGLKNSSSLQQSINHDSALYHSFGAARGEEGDFHWPSGTGTADYSSAEFVRPAAGFGQQQQQQQQQPSFV